MIFQSEYQASLHLKYPEKLFSDGTFYSAPKLAYQLLITRVYSKELNKFFTTSFSLLTNKEQNTYYQVFNTIKNHIFSLNKNKKYCPSEFPADFEIAMSNAFKSVFPDSKIKYCLWHFERNLEINKNKICYKEVNENKDIFILYKCITKLPYIDPHYLEDLYLLIKTKSNNRNFLEFLKYFYKTYFLKYPVENWNYFDNIEDTTNNRCESYNHHLYSYFNKKPTFYKLLFILREEENYMKIEEEKL